MDTKQTKRPAEPGRKSRPQGARHPGQAEPPRKKPAPQSTGAKRPGTPKHQLPKAQAPRAPQEKTRQARAPQSQQPRRPAPQEPERRKAPQPEQKRAPARSKAPARPAPQKTPPKAAPKRSAKKTTARRDKAPRVRSAGAFQEKRRVRAPKRNAPAVVYTQPTPFNVNRLLIQLLTVAAVVLALTLSLSLFFKVEVITVSGAEAYSEWAIREASGIEVGESLLTFSRARAGGRIKMELPYVDKVRFGIKLPNTVIIDIEELDVVYAIQSWDGHWWLMTSDGRILEQTDGGTAGGYTKVEGVKLESPVVNQQAVAHEEPAPTTSTVTVTNPPDPTGESTGESVPLGTTPPVVTQADRLEVALEILKALELNDIVGEAASVNVTSLNDIELWYGTRYRVRMGGRENLEYKIECMKEAIAKMSDYQMGILDVSFDQWSDKVGYTPFE